MKRWIHENGWASMCLVMLLLLFSRCSDTSVVQDGDDPCEGQTCSGHGTCAVSGDAPLCVCDEGYHGEGDTNCVPDEGNSISCGAGTHEENGFCVPDGTEHPPASWTHVSDDIAFPGDMRMSPDGRHLIYAPLTSLGGGVFEPTTVLLRDLSTQNEIDLCDAELACGSGGCMIRQYVRMFSPDSQYVMLANTVYELSSGAGTPLPPGLASISFSPDSSGVVCHDAANARLVHVSIPDLSIDFLMDTNATSTHDLCLGFFSGSQGVQVVANVPVSGGHEIRVVPIIGGSSVLLAQDVLGGTYAKGSMVASSAGHVVFQAVQATTTNVHSVPFSGGSPVLLGKTSGPVINRLLLSPDETSVLITDDNSYSVVPVEGGATNVLGVSGEVYWRWADNVSLAYLTVPGEIYRYPLPSGPSELIADGVTGLSAVDGTRLLYTRTQFSGVLSFVQGTISGADNFMTKTLYMNKDGIESLLWRDVELGPTSIGQSAVVVNESLTLVALNVMYFDIMRDWAPGPNNGVWLAPLP